MNPKSGNASSELLGMTARERQFIIDAVADGGRDLPALQIGELLANTVEIARVKKGRREGTRAVEALLKYEMHRQNLQVKASEVRAQQQQIADLQMQLQQRPDDVGPQPLRIVIEENNDRADGGPQDSAVAAPIAGAPVDAEHARDVRPAVG